MLSNRIVIAAITLVTAGCTTTYVQQIGTFQQAVNSVNSSLTTYFSNMDNFEREIYLDDVAFDQSKQVLEHDANGQATALLGTPFSAEAIKARTDAIAVVGLYAQRLSDLANSSAPTQFATNTNTLASSLTNLSKTFTGLTGKGDPTATKYIDPIGALVGSLGQLYLNGKVDEAVNEAIKNGNVPLHAILSQIEADLNNVVKPELITGYGDMLNNRIQYYNRNKDKLSLSDRQAALQNIESEAQTYEAAIALNPEQSIGSISKAYDALLSYAQDPTKNEKFLQYLASLQTALQEAQILQQEVSAIKSASK